MSELNEVAFDIAGMNCASCVAHVERAAKTTAGVGACDVNLARGRAVVKFDPTQTDAHKIAGAITAAGYPAIESANLGAAGEAQRLERQSHHARAWARRAIIGLILWLPVESTHWFLEIFRPHPHHQSVTWMTWLALVTSTISILYVGAGFYRSAFGALRRRTSNMDTLIALGASVAYGYSLVALIGFLAGEWRTLPNLYFMESAGLLALISLGHWLESRARQSAGRAIRELLTLAPAVAQKIIDPHKNLETKTVAVAELNIGDIVLVRPGDRVPIDGVIVAGRSSLDESMISGEPLPVSRGAGETVIGGTLNHDGALQIRVTKTGSQTALAQIVKLVETAQSSKPAVQKLADQIAAIFVPSVLGIATLTGLIWFIVGRSLDWESSKIWSQIALTVCSVLIIACPCALGLAVPAALMVGTGRGAKKGVLIRDIDALQNAERIDTIVVDKTGTITQGKPVVRKIISRDSIGEDEILRLAAAAEQFSEHPLARAVVAAAREKNLSLPAADSFNNEPGLGVVAQIENQNLLVGNADLLAQRDLHVTNSDHGTTVFLASQQNGRATLLGEIAIDDQIKSDSSAAITRLHAMNLQTVLLSGDNAHAAGRVAKSVGIDDIRADVRPDGKASAIRELQNQNKIVAMVGDGVNDAPALAQANLGIAIGSGSDIAKETGDIVLVGNSLHGIATAILLSRATMRIVRQNLFFAFAYNVLAIPIAAGALYPLGISLNPYLAAAAMALSDVTVLGNALRLHHAKID